MKRVASVLLAALVSVAALSAAAQTAAPRYHVIELPLVSGAKGAQPSAINHAGQVVGYTTETATKTATYQGWLWTPATSTAAARIQALPPLKNFPHSYACDINNAGQVVGYSYGTAKSATLWQAATPTSPVNFNDPAVKGAWLPGYVLTDALSLSDPDATGAYYVTGWANYTDPVTGKVSRWQGVVWKMQAGRMVSAARLQYPDPAPANLEDLVTDPWDVNVLGQVAGDYSANWQNSRFYPCIWNAEDGTMGQMASIGGGSNSINNGGSVVGESTPRGFLWVPLSQEVQYLGEPGGSQTIAHGLNSGNQIVGQTIYSTSFVRSACLWQPRVDAQGVRTFQFYDLNKCKSTGATSIALYEAQGVNDSGWIIGSHSNRSWRAFLLTPIK